MWLLQFGGLCEYTHYRNSHACFNVNIKFQIYNKYLEFWETLLLINKHLKIYSISLSEVIQKSSKESTFFCAHQHEWHFLCIYLHRQSLLSVWGILGILTDVYCYIIVQFESHYNWCGKYFPKLTLGNFSILIFYPF